MMSLLSHSVDYGGPDEEGPVNCSGTLFILQQTHFQGCFWYITLPRPLDSVLVLCYLTKS